MVAVLTKSQQVLLIVCIFHTSMAKRCQDHGKCGHYISETAWSGHPCSHRNNIGSSRYEPNLSYKMLLLSSAAYDKTDPQKCLDKALPPSKFKLLAVINTTKCVKAFLCGCSGFLAVSDVEKAIVVAFRGCTGKLQVLKVFLKTLFPKKTFLDGKVQNYWSDAFTYLWGCMESEVKALLSNYPDYQIWVTGHSLGGAIASLASTWLAYHNIAPTKDIVLYTFGMPRVGDYDYALQHDKLVKNSWRVVNYDDPVPHFPSYRNHLRLKGPYHHGVEVYYTKPATSVNSAHKECHGKPFNEDVTCSFTTTFSDSTKNHRNYFSILIGTYCSSDVHKKRPNTEQKLKLKFSKDHCSVYR